MEPIALRSEQLEKKHKNKAVEKVCRVSIYLASFIFYNINSYKVDKHGCDIVILQEFSSYAKIDCLLSNLKRFKSALTE